MAGEPFNPLVALTDVVADAVDWIHDTFSDPELSEEVRGDLGLDTDDRPQGELPSGDSIRMRHPNGDPVDVDKEAFAATVAEIRDTFALLRQFFGSLGLDTQTLGDVLFLVGQIGAAESIRVRWPLVHAIARAAGFLGGLGSQDEVEALDIARAIDLLGGKSNVPTDTSDPGKLEGLRNWVGVGTAAVVAAKPDLLPGSAKASYGFEPDIASTTPLSDETARAAYTLDIAEQDPVGTTGFDGHVALTVIYVPAAGPTPFRVYVALGGAVSYTNGRFQLGLDVTGRESATSFLFTRPWDWDNAELTDVVTATATYGRSDLKALEFGEQDGPHLTVDAIALRVELSAAASIRLELKGVDISLALKDADTFLASLGRDLTSRFDLALVYDKDGLRFEGGPGSAGAATPGPSGLAQPRALTAAAGTTSGGLEATVPASTAVGPFRIQHGHFAIGRSADATPRSVIELSATAAIDLGPFHLTIDRIGMSTALRAGGADPNLGLVDLDVGFKPPTGIGVTIDAKAVRGGGFLYLDADKGEYAGVMELAFSKLAVKAFGILNTKAPAPADWSLLLLVFAEFRQTPIQLGLGFNLTAVGGIIGLQHHASVDELRAAIGTNAYDDVLFPVDPVSNAPRILGRLRTIFPVRPNALVVGPTVEINWGTPPIVTARLGILAQFDGAFGGGEFRFTRLTILGTVTATAPPVTVDAPRLVQLTADLLGDYDVESGLIAIDARLRDSKLGGVEFSGSLIIRVGIGDNPAFAIAAGGFHPAFTDLPPALPGRIDRLGLRWQVGSAVTLTLQAYAAITASSWQLGATFTLVAEIGPVDIDGGLSFDAVAYDDGRFSVDIGGHVKIRWRGHTLMAVGIEMVLDRNARQVWHAAGSASFSVLWWDKEVDFEHTWGDERSLPPAATVDAGAKVRAALADRRNWATNLPGGGEPLVTLADAGGSATAALAHPLGTLIVDQRVAPLGLRLDHLDGAPLAARTTVEIGAVRIGAAQAATTGTVSQPFPRARFQNLSDSERLTHKTFETFPSGIQITPPGDAHPTGTLAEFGFEPLNMPPIDEPVTAPPRPVTFPPGHLSWHVLRGQAARCELRRPQRLGAAEPSRRVDVRQPTVAVVDARTLAETAALSDAEARSPVLARQRVTEPGALVLETQDIGG